MAPNCHAYLILGLQDCRLLYIIPLPKVIFPSHILACLDGAEVSVWGFRDCDGDLVSGLKIGRSLVKIPPKTNFSIMIKLPV